jgi:RNA polymerase sigma-70 factor (ECF subfamily)
MAQREEDFLMLVRKNKGQLRKICRVYADTEAAQKDLYQDILMALWRSLPSFEGKADPGTWLYRVALNTALSHDRRQAVREEATLSDDNPLRAGSVPSPDATVEEHDVELPYATVHGIVRYELEAKPKAGGQAKSPSTQPPKKASESK